MVSQNSVNETSNFNLSSNVALFVNSKWKQNLLKYILQVHENYFNNPIIVHLLISFSGDFLFSFGDKKRKT